MPSPYVFTFYSYKGGVGRSLAVMNVAYALAGRGRHVLLVDMDLEAPGVSGFLERSKELAAPDGNAKDILTLLGEAIRALDDNGGLEERARNLPPVSNYIRAVAGEKLKALEPLFGTLGRLDVLGTDLSRKYHERLAELDLQGLSQNRLIGLSRLLNYYFKAQAFPHRPIGVEDFEPPIQTSYDYVLVDSRTGITEIGGLCVGPLADRLVVITGLNDQNVNGTMDFLREVGIQPEPRKPSDKPWDDADNVRADQPDNPSLGPKPTIVVASPVPSGEVTYKRQRLAELKRLLGIQPFSLSYHPRMALMESVFVRDFREEYLASEYQGLATGVMSQIGDDPPHLALDVQAASDKNPARAVTSALRLVAHLAEIGIPVLTLLGNKLSQSGRPIPEARQLYAVLSRDAASRPSALTNWGATLAELARTKTGEEADRLFTKAYARYAEAIVLKPDHLDAMINWGAAILYQTEKKDEDQADRLFEEANSKHADALRIDPNSHNALANWGAALSRQAMRKRGEEADRLFAAAGVKFAEALRLRESYETFFNWGHALSRQAWRKEGPEAEHLLAAATAKFAEVLRLKPDHHAALSEWGIALGVQARTRQREEADRLFEEAGAKFAEALRLKPDYHHALNNWGTALSDQAETKTGEEADRLFAQGGLKYAEALRLKPDDHNTLNNWGAALLAQATKKEDEEARRLRQFARQKFVEAERIRGGSATYNLACLAAIEGNQADAVRWLEACSSRGQSLSKARLAGEKDFDKIRRQPEFVSFVQTLPDTDHR